MQSTHHSRLHEHGQSYRLSEHVRDLPVIRATGFLVSSKIQKIETSHTRPTLHDTTLVHNHRNAHIPHENAYEQLLSSSLSFLLLFSPFQNCTNTPIPFRHGSAIRIHLYLGSVT